MSQTNFKKRNTVKQIAERAQTVYTLSAEERALIDELVVKGAAIQKQAADVELQAQRLVLMVIRAHRLRGNWTYNDGVLNKVETGETA